VRALLLLLAASLASACGSAPPSARGGGPRASALPTPDVLGPRERKGQFAFMHTCNPCHPQAGGGLGAPLDTKPFPLPAIRAKVRGLVPGDMPKFSEIEISDDDVDAISAYLKAIRPKI